MSPHRPRPSPNLSPSPGPGPTPLFTHLHALALLGSYALQFPRLVDSPQLGLLSGLLPLCAVQIGYAVLCLGAGAGGGPTGPANFSTSRKMKTPSAGVRPKKVETGGGFTHHVLVFYFPHISYHIHDSRLNLNSTSTNQKLLYTHTHTHSPSRSPCS